MTIRPISRSVLRFLAAPSVWLDCFILVTVGVTLLVVAIYLDFGEVVSEWIREHEAWELDELTLIFDFLFLGLAWFALRRWQETSREARKRSAAIAEMEQSEELLRLATGATGIGTYSIDLRTGERQWSQEMRAILGLSGDAPLNRDSFRTHIHPDDRERADQEFDRKLSDTSKPVQVQYRVIQPATGDVRWVAEVSRTLTDKAGQPVRLVGTLHDVTREKQAELALRQSEERYRLLAENATDVIFRTGLDGQRLYLSQSARDIYGYDPEELLGTEAAHLIHPDDVPTMKADLEATIAGKPGHETTVYRIRHKAGHWVWLEARRKLVRDGDGAPVEVVGIIRDISKRKRLEEQLRQAQKMEAVGQLTGGIAHDFNNLLTVILGNAEMLAGDPTDAALTSGLSRQILEAAERGADLTQKLLAFGRRQSLKPERLKLSRAVDEMVPLLHRTLGEHIELETDLHEGSLAALTDQTLLVSAILNLAVNARDAMPRHGTLTIRTGERLARSAEGSLPMGQPVVYVTVSDTGAGIPAEVLPRVFEPFFTTKEVGKGSGLGLSMVYGFAEQTGGHVSIESQEGVGTSVTIVLPAVTPATAQARQDDKVPTLVTPTERVLLVEDQPEVLKFASSLLLNLGYEVEAVSTGPDALELLTRDSRFDLLFSDVVLPKGMSGVELAQRAREMKPDLKVLLTSGYSEDIFEHHGRPDEGTLLLRKPYRRKDLAAILTKVLASEPPSQGGRSKVVAFPSQHERRRA